MLKLPTARRQREMCHEGRRVAHRAPLSQSPPARDHGEKGTARMAPELSLCKSLRSPDPSEIGRATVHVTVAVNNNFVLCTHALTLGLFPVH